VDQFYTLIFAGKHEVLTGKSGLFLPYHIL
jgi:hypothetical protein